MSRAAAPLRRSLIPVVASAILLAPAACITPVHASELLVKFQPRVDHTHVWHTLTALGAHQVKAIPDIGVRVVSVPAGGARRALVALKGSRSVAFAEADAVAKPQESVPNNPYFPEGNYALSGGAWGWWQTHTTQAWDITQGSPAVVIAILDTGLKPQGLNFGTQIVQGYDILNGTTDTTTYAGNHGTYVAGAAVQAFNDAAGNAGYCASCDVMPVQVGTDSGASYSDMATGITWAADHGAKIENLSWAGTSSSSTLASAVSYASSKGVIVFAAAGNSNCNCATYPAATPGVLGVAGVDNTGNKAGDSNYGSWVAVAAPEGNMTSWPSLNGGPGFGPVGGTSLAAPAAAGIAGLILSVDPSLTLPQLEQTLQNTATAVPFQVAYGEVDAMAALRSLGYFDPQQATAPVNTAAPQLLVETNGAYNTAPLTTAPQVGQVLLRGQGAWTGSSPLLLSTVEWDRCNPDGTGCTVLSTTSNTYTVQSADAGYSLRIKISFTDPNGTTTAASALSAPVGGTIGGIGTTSVPANTSLPTISGTAQAGQTLSASSGSWSESPTSYVYQWQRCDSAGGNCTAIAGATSSSYAVVSADVGYTLRVAVTAANAAGSATAVSNPTAVVASAPVSTQTLTFSGSLSSKHPTAGFGVSVGTGLAEARLSYSAKCPPLTLGLDSSAGATVAGKSGPSVLVLSQTLSAGSYTYVVSGSTRCSFTLTVASVAP